MAATKKKYDTFDSMDEFLSEELMRGIFGFGFEYPSKIQREVIPKIIANEDVVAQSQSGTGKTGCFVISALAKIDPKIKKPQVIILAHTKELAKQIYTVVGELSKYMGIKLSFSVGLTNKKENIETTKKSHIIIGTPGRVCDLTSNNHYDKDELKLLIMDEGDKLLCDDFIEPLTSIITNMNHKIQFCVFSATFDNEIIETAKTFMENPYVKTIENDKVSLEQIYQFRIRLYDEINNWKDININKIDIVNEIYGKLNISQCIIFVNHFKNAELLCRAMRSNNHQVNYITGKMSREDREMVFKDFRNGEYRTLISTDLLGRGIDVQQIGIVINFDIPRENGDSDNAQYIHRVGRSGRFGKRGVAINLVSVKEQNLIDNIESKYGITIRDMPDPEYVNSILNG
jgi:translation initiation factor 4A